MATTAELKGRVTLDASSFRRTLAGVKRDAVAFGRDVGPSFAAIGPKLAQVTAAVTAFGAALVGIGVKKNFDLETMQLQFETLLGSANAAATRMAELKTFASKTPFELGDVAAVNKMLETVGEGGQDMLTLVGDAAAATGTDFKDLGKIMQKALAMQKAGVGLGDVINQLNERALLSAEGFRKLRKESAEGLSTPETLRILMDELGKFDGAMKKLSGTGAGLFSTLKDDAGFALAEITKGFADASKLGLQALIDKIGEMSADGTFQRWGQEISNTIQSLIYAWRSLSEEQKNAFFNMAKVAAGFALAWKAGLVQPLISMTAALASRVIAMLSPQFLLGGLIGIPAFIAGIGIGNALEKQFNLSGILLRFGAWGAALLKHAFVIAATLVSPFVNAGQAIAAALAGDMEGAKTFAKMALDWGAKGDHMVGALKMIHKDLEAELAAIATTDPPAKPFNMDEFLKSVKDEVGLAFDSAGKMIIANADRLRQLLAEKLGIDVAGDALGQFLAAMENFKPAVGGPLPEIEKQAQAAGAAVDGLQNKMRGLFFRGGKINSFDIGAQAGGGGGRLAGGTDRILQEWRGGLRNGKPIDTNLPEVGAAANAKRLRADFDGKVQPAAGAQRIRTDFVGKVQADQLKVNQMQLAELRKLNARGATGSTWY